MNLINYLSSSIVFWMAWIIIPLIMEIIPAVWEALVLLRKGFVKNDNNISDFPEITVIIPVYNSASTLYGCLESIYLSSYPNDKIKIMLVNNQGIDNSFQIYRQCQNEFKDLSLLWLNAKQGKSKALNLALFNSEGKYIIHIDSDGKLHRDALKNVVTRFELNSDIHCMTGSVLTDPELIESTNGFLMRMLRRIEFCEYCQAFFAGRNFQSEMDSIYTLSGAFSAFRKSTILKTQLYNTDTICEDTHVTFQIKKILKKKVFLCENALFFVDPIESFNKLYTQRQRWQRGEIEVAHMFMDRNLFADKGLFSNHALRFLIYDHTFAFPRMIWYFALICLIFMNYSLQLVAGSLVLILFLYILSAFLFYFDVLLLLKQFRELRQYYMKKWYAVALLPIFNFIVFWIRFAGIINSIKSDSSWRTKTLTDEWKGLTKVLYSDFAYISKFIEKMKSRYNNE
ncbi:putative glycosyltransferase, exosortase G system-associated [Ruminiclostridium herbifermentans]|uniref:Putative glycosyltransferase, exosortase G system-associated n=1 Tax=Ruminiclostridium herbifermentans TaxID=2488810 RepID=A0A4U7J6J2_9FIRM|nr:TIGR03111 family XrtG-associated glycosyltransferase [Ruminiclostridium herbifermentans]QNU66959.1 putative glycosyltransferase, exosortase G system-associated [Ruminiclostridium herbifermentans]